MHITTSLFLVVAAVVGWCTAVVLPPSLTEQIAANPLRDEPNLSYKPPSKGKEYDVIRGSRRAMTITRKTYLKKEWCKTEPLRQVIRERGCQRFTIINRFCYGQCNSFFIPKSDRKDVDGGAAFQSCSFCKPKRFTWSYVRLRCPGQRPPVKKKRIRRIKQCKCMAQDLR